MSNKQRWWFILFTLPVCALLISIGLSNLSLIPNKVDLNLRVGNVWSNATTYQSYAKQETLNIDK